MNPDTSHSSASDVGTFDYECLLDFSTPSSGNKMINGDDQKLPKQLACTRCHARKLRCVRRSPSERTCDRCFAANVQCIARQLQRMGRPVDHNKNISNTTNAVRSHQKSRQRGTSRRNESVASSATVNSDGGATPSLRRTTDPPLSRRENTGIDTVNVSSNDNDIPIDLFVDMPVEHNGNRSNGGSTSTTTTQFTPASYTTSNSDMRSLWPSPTEPTSYTDSLMTGLGGPDSLFPNFDDLPATLFPRSINAAAFEPNLDSNPSSLFDDIPDDPVEQLSRLHLNLYQCLTSVKAVEKLKNQKLRNMSGQTGDIDTSWLQHLFRTTERFINSLTSYLNNKSLTSTSKTTSTDIISESREFQEPHTIVEVDTATGLMIVSCYMRLLQILEVVVFVIETYRDFDCPGSYIEIRFGSFVPKTDKALSVRLLGQYVLHLLDCISEAVDKAIASRQLYTRAITDAQRIQTKLKERISISLH